MNTFLGGLASNGLLVLPLLSLALLIRRWQPERPALLHGLLLLVFLKLLTPPLWTFSAFPVAQIPPEINSAASQVTPSALAGEGMALGRHSKSTGAVLPWFGEEEADLGAHFEASSQAQVPSAAFHALEPGPSPAAVLTPAAPAEPISAREFSAFSSWNWLYLLVGLWSAGAVCWLVIVVGRLARFLRLLRHAEPAPPWLDAMARKLAERLGCRTPPPVELLQGCVAPMLWSWGRTTRIFLPSALVSKLDRQALASLLLHELAHFHRRDHWVRYLELAAFTLYWWHPGVWLARRLLREAEEECCDAQVANALNGERRAYAAAILATLDFLAATPQPLPVAGSGLSSFHHLRRRLIMLQSPTRGSSLRWPGKLALLGLALLALPLGARLTGEPPSNGDAQAQPPRDERSGPGGPGRSGGGPPPREGGGPREGRRGGAPRVDDGGEPGGPPPREGERPEGRRGNRPPPPEGEPGEPGPGAGAGRPGMMRGRGPLGDNAEDARQAELDRNERLFEARSEIRLMRIQLRMREEELREAQERMENAKQRISRISTRREQGAASEEELQNAREMVNRAESQLRVRMIALEEARERIAIAEERLQLMEQGKIRTGGPAGFPGRGGMMGGPGGAAGSSGPPPRAEGGDAGPMRGNPTVTGPFDPGFGRGAGRPSGPPGGAGQPAGASNEEEVNRLKRELDQLRREVERLRGKGEGAGK